MSRLLSSILAGVAGLLIGVGSGALIAGLAGGGSSGAPHAGHEIAADELQSVLLGADDLAAWPLGTAANSDVSTATWAELHGQPDLDTGGTYQNAACEPLTAILLAGDGDAPVATAIARTDLLDGFVSLQHRIQWFPDADAAATAFATLEPLVAECGEVALDLGDRTTTTYFEIVDPVAGEETGEPTLEVRRVSYAVGTERIVYQLAGNVISSLLVPEPDGGWLADQQYARFRDRVEALLAG